jgi:hypothetical protein
MLLPTLARVQRTQRLFPLSFFFNMEMAVDVEVALAVAEMADLVRLI